MATAMITAIAMAAIRMPRGLDARVRAKRQSALDWARRIALAITALVAAYVVGMQSLAMATLRSSADRAYALAPWDAEAAARKARASIPTNGDTSRLVVADALAKFALKQDPLSVDALVTLGLDAQFRGEQRHAKEYLKIAQMLSRRDLQVELWSIEEAVARGDVATALAHYDIALRTSRSARELLFPVLAGAIADPALADAAVRVMSTRPAWAPDFIYFLSTNAPDPSVAASFVGAAKTAGIAVSDASEASLTDALINRGELDKAWNFYATSHGKVDRARSRDPRFAYDQASRAQFDWQLLGNDGVSASVERAERANVLAFSIAPGASGLIVRQLQLLPAGPYVIRGKAMIDAAEGSSMPRWELSCQDGRPLGQVALAGANGNIATFTTRIVVPVGCPAQYLALLARPGAGSQTTTGEIHEVTLTPATGS